MPSLKQRSTAEEFRRSPVQVQTWLLRKAVIRLSKRIAYLESLLEVPRG